MHIEWLVGERILELLKWEQSVTDENVLSSTFILIIVWVLSGFLEIGLK